MNPLLSRLQPYPFERLRQLHAGITPSPQHRPISLGIGEPRHAAPDFLKKALADTLPVLIRRYQGGWLLVIEPVGAA